MSFLPQELVDMIILEFSYDQKALRTCALVAKNWVTPARHLGIVTLHPMNHINFFDLMRSPYTTVFYATRTLHLHDGGSGGPWGGEPWIGKHIAPLSTLSKVSAVTFQSSAWNNDKYSKLLGTVRVFFKIWKIFI